MAQTKRRSVIKLAGSAAAVASTGMAGILATGRTPAYAQQKTVHWLRWVDFVPASDQLMRKELMPQAEKDLGIKINFETVNGNDLQPRATAAIRFPKRSPASSSLIAERGKRSERLPSTRPRRRIGTPMP